MYEEACAFHAVHRELAVHMHSIEKKYFRSFLKYSTHVRGHIPIDIFATFTRHILIEMSTSDMKLSGPYFYRSSCAMQLRRGNGLSWFRIATINTAS